MPWPKMAAGEGKTVVPTVCRQNGFCLPPQVLRHYYGLPTVTDQLAINYFDYSNFSALVSRENRTFGD